MSRPLRSHQKMLSGIVTAIATGQSDVTNILAAVTPGGGKSVLAPIAAAALIGAGKVDKVVWTVPRASLGLQAEEAFADPSWRSALGHNLSVRFADNTADPSRGLSGYVTTYQAVAASPDLHLREFHRARTLLVVDEVHHLPALAEIDPMAAAQEALGMPGDEEAGAWSRAIQPLLEAATFRLLLSGTLERADGRSILWLPYRTGSKASSREVDLDAPRWAIVGYSRAQALSEKAVLPVKFGALDGEATWRDETGTELGPHRLRASHPEDTTRPALYTALRTEYAHALLQEAFRTLRRIRTERRAARASEGKPPGERLAKLLVVAPDQVTARSYLGVVRALLPNGVAADVAQVATSSTPRAHEILAAFRLHKEPSILITCAMAYEGMDAPQVAVVAALTHIRSRPWLEQMVARATRIDPDAGPYDTQTAVVFHPDDPLFGVFRRRMESEQGTRATKPKPSRGQGVLPLWLRDQLPSEREGITPLSSNALALRYDILAPGPELALRRPEQVAAQQEMLEAPSAMERRLRVRIGSMVAAQAVEDGLERTAPSGPGLYVAYNAILKRVGGGKRRSELTLSELEAAIGWLERNRLSDHLCVLEGDARYQWITRNKSGAGLKDSPATGPTKTRETPSRR